MGPTRPKANLMRIFPSSLLWLAALVMAAAGCAEASRSKAELPAPIECREGLTIGADGECGVPSIGPGDVTAPETEFEAPTIDNSDVDHDRGYFLTQEGPGKFRVYTGETIPIGVRAITYVGQAAPGLTVDFKPVGDLYGTTLSASQAVSNNFGIAQIAVTGGTRPTHFIIQMTAPDASSLQYQVDVVQPPEGGDLAPPEPDDGGDVEPNPPGGGLDDDGSQCGLETRGTYAIHNRYEPGRVLGDGPFRVLDQIHEALSNPGGFVADLIADRIDGVWGDVIRAAIGPVINYLFDYVVNNYAPEWVQWMLIITEDISGVLTELEIEGTMELGPRDAATCMLRGKHRWETLVFIWRAGCPPGDERCGRFEYPMQQLGVALSESEFDAHITQNLGPVGTMEIGQHQLQLNIGVAVLWFVENVILPQRLEVNSFGELLGLVLPCDAVGQLAADYVSGIPFLGFAVAPFVEEACQAGLEAAGNFLMRQLADQLNVSAFDMAGECKIRDTTQDRNVDKLEQGRWNQGLEGDFTGERR